MTNPVGPDDFSATERIRELTKRVEAQQKRMEWMAEDQMKREDALKAKLAEATKLCANLLEELKLLHMGSPERIVTVFGIPLDHYAGLLNALNEASAGDVEAILAERTKLLHDVEALKRAKAENDERFMTERDEARADRDALRESLRAALAHLSEARKGK